MSPKPYKPNLLVEALMSNLSNYPAKADLKNATGTDTSKSAAMSDLSSLNAEVYKLDIDKLIPVPVDLSKFIDLVKNNVVK